MDTEATTEWTCGDHHDSNPPFAEIVRASRCMGGRRGPCSTPIVMVFVAINDGDGSQPIPPLCFTGACAKHRDRIRQLAKSLQLGWLGFNEIPIGEVPQLIAWFHGPSGLCKGDRGLSILAPPGASRPRD